MNQEDSAIIEKIKLLSENVIDFHEQLTKEYGSLEGIRDRNLLDSAINGAFQTAFEQDVFPTVFDKAAKILIGIVKNHPFIDGNKRTAIHTMEVFLSLEFYNLTFSQEELENLVVDAAEDKITIENLSDILEKNTEYYGLRDLIDLIEEFRENDLIELMWLDDDI